MLVYHISDRIVEHPDLSYAVDSADFGKGFYVYLNKPEEVNCCVNCYELHASFFIELSVLELDYPSAVWLEFILGNNHAKLEDYDIIAGSSITDEMFNDIELYKEGYRNSISTVYNLSKYEPCLQLCIKNQDSIDKFLQFKGGEFV